MELLAVIVILAVILLIAVPSVISIIDKAKQGTYENQLSLIEKMAETYSLTTNLSYDENGEAYFTLGDMMELGVAPEPVADPRCGKSFVEETRIKATNTNGIIKLELDEIISECEIEGNAPIITNVTTSVDGTSITVSVEASVEERSIKEYSYSKDNGTTWISGGSNSSYTFTNLQSQTSYSIKVKVKNNNYLSTISDTVSATTDSYIPEITVDNGLIPITHNGTSWVVADTSSEWYDYSNKEWANAISVTETSRSTYVPGKVVTEADVLAYYVYIPRYKYQLFNTGTDTVSEQTINIEFQSLLDLKATGSTNGSWLTHPAFTFGDEELEGMWVGKFEVTGTTSSLTIKPNVTSLRSASVSNFFYAIQSMSDSGNTYGLTTSTDTHMMKNTEWGAVAYLSHSEYGINTEIRINNNSSFKTGCGATTQNADGISSCQITYGSSVTNQPQSTTGNITGIYDMNGGSAELVMGFYFTGDTISGLDATFFTTSANYKYYNDYTNVMNDRILGDATVETMGWYSDGKTFLSSDSQIFNRGAGHLSQEIAGIFSYFSTSVTTYRTTRVVLLP